MSVDAKTSVLIVKRYIQAPRDRVFALMTDPSLIHRWFNGAEMGRTAMKADIRVGGRYQCEMMESHNVYTPHGEYLEITPPERIRFSWVAEGMVPYSEVTIELHEKGEGTEVVLSHELPSEDLVQPHRSGWTWVLLRLAGHAEIGTQTIPENPTFAAGENIAIKVPAYLHAQTVSFYRDTLALPIVKMEENSVAFKFGGITLWVDKVATQTHADIWLEVKTPDLEAAAAHFRRTRTPRRDEIEPLPEGMEAMWITDPSGVIHLVSKG